MKLQIEHNATPDFLGDAELVSDIVSEDGSAEVTELLRSGIKAAQEGNRAEARNLLLQATEIEPKNENAWLWLASISEYPEELLIFLSNVLSVNPENERALEWEKSTKSLLSRTFVQRGIEAFKDSQKDFAKQSFLQAIVHDDRNEMAWLWLASMSDVIEEKKSHLVKVLGIDPTNETALESLKAVKKEMARTLLAKAMAAAANGERKAAEKMLKELLINAPDVEDVWILKAFMTDSFSEKVECFEQVLSIDPDNETAETCLSSLQTVIGRTTAAVNPEDFAVETEEVLPEPIAADDEPGDMLELRDEASDEPEPVKLDEADVDETSVELAAVVIDGEKFYSPKEIADSPTQDLRIADELQEYFDPAEDLTFAEPSEVQSVEMNFVPVAEPAPVQDVQTEFPTDEAHAKAEQKPVVELAFDEVAPAAVDSQTPEPAPEENAQADVPQQSMAETVPEHKAAATAFCPFCEAENGPQDFICSSCSTMLSLSDVEMLLAHRDADRDLLERAVERMEIEKGSDELTSEDLKQLGIAHLNLKNLRRGFEYLQESLKLNPNDVLLNSQVNSLAIRISEIEEKQNTGDSTPKNKTILVVDDSATVRKLISGKLEKCGHEVICAIDGMDALEKINEEIPDLILLDITMPRMDGYQVCKLIRSNDATREIPVVMISGKDGFFDKVRGRMAGTTGYITKPFGPETLMKTVETYIS